MEDEAMYEAKILLWGMCGLALAGLTGFALIAVNASENRAATKALLTARDDLAQAGWRLNWRTMSSRFAILSTETDLTDVRLSGYVGDKHLLYGCDHVTVKTGRFQSGHIRLTFGGSQALAVASGTDKSGSVIFAMRLSGHGSAASVHFAENSDAGGKAIFILPEETADIEVSPIRYGATSGPLILQLIGVRSVITWSSVSKSQFTLASDTSLASVRLPFSVTGLGNRITALRAAASVSGSSGDAANGGGNHSNTTFTLHIGEGKLGPLSATLAGRLVYEKQSTGDFNLTLHGLDQTAHNLSEAGSISPPVAQIAHLFSLAVTRASRGLSVKENPVGPDDNDPGQTADKTSLTLPVRIRNGSWMVGNLPVETLGSLLPGNMRPVR